MRCMPKSEFGCYKIVALQSAIEYMAKEFPGSFDDYLLSVIESHQAAKADTSGKCMYSGGVIFIDLYHKKSTICLEPRNDVFPPPSICLC